MTTMVGGTGTVTRLPMHRRVAAEIRAYKARLEVTQVELAELLEVSQQGISRRLSGRTPFTLDEIDVLAARFGVHPAVLLGGQGDAPEGPPPSVVRREGIEPPTR